jgi:hypothetical protein
VINHQAGVKYIKNLNFLVEKRKINVKWKIAIFITISYQLKYFHIIDI